MKLLLSLFHPFELISNYKAYTPFGFCFLFTTVVKLQFDLMNPVISWVPTSLKFENQHLKLCQNFKRTINWIPVLNVPQAGLLYNNCQPTTYFENVSQFFTIWVATSRIVKRPLSKVARRVMLVFWLIRILAKHKRLVNPCSKVLISLFTRENFKQLTANERVTVGAILANLGFILKQETTNGRKRQNMKLDFCGWSSEDFWVHC